MSQIKHHGRPRVQVSARKPIVQTIFDLFYPLAVAAIVIYAGAWFFEIPIDRTIEASLQAVTDRLMFWR